MMHRLMLGMLLAAGAASPMIAAAQDRPPDAGQHERGGERPHDGGGRSSQPRAAAQQAPAPQPQAQARPQLQAQSQPQPQTQPQSQPQARSRFEGRGDGGRFRGDGGARFEGGDPHRAVQQQQGFRPDAGQPGRGFNGDPNRAGGQPQAFRRDDGQPGRGFNGDPNRGAQPGYRGPQNGPGGYAPQADGRGPAPHYRSSPAQGRPGGGTWNRGWRGDDRYDWGRYRAQNRSAFHLPRYYAPPSWRYGYRRFSPGFTLSAELFDQGFWIDDAYEYRLPPAAWPYQWVRYYNDALLVDVRTGYVVDTVYDIFW